MHEQQALQVRPEYNYKHRDVNQCPACSFLPVKLQTAVLPNVPLLAPWRPQGETAAQLSGPPEDETNGSDLIHTDM